jgi:hypothetical protein
LIKQVVIPADNVVRSTGDRARENHIVVGILRDDFRDPLHPDEVAILAKTGRGLSYRLVGDVGITTPDPLATEDIFVFHHELLADNESDGPSLPRGENRAGGALARNGSLDEHIDVGGDSQHLRLLPGAPLLLPRFRDRRLDVFNDCRSVDLRVRIPDLVENPECLFPLTLDTLIDLIGDDGDEGLAPALDEKLIASIVCLVDDISEMIPDCLSIDQLGHG